MMEAWLSSSEQITDAQRPIVSITPRLAAYPVVNSTAASAPRQAAMRSSRRSCPEQITDAQRPIVSITPRLAAYPVVNSTAASAPRQAAMRSSCARGVTPR